MSSQKIITVIGATGNQGGSVIDTILSSSTLSAKYALRAITRDTSKPAAQKLASRGVSVVKGDLTNVDSLKEAFAGTYAVFGVTDFWQLHTKEAEFAQGKAIADAAFAVGAKHLVWSSLPHATRLTEGKLSGVPHFDSKAEVQDYIEKAKASTGTKATYVQLGSYLTNLSQSVRPGQDGVPSFAGPLDPETARIPWFDAAADTGKYVAGVLEAGPEKADGVTVRAVGDWLSPAETMKQVTEVRGKEYKFVELPREVFKSFLPAGLAEELTQTFELMNLFHYYGRDTEKEQAESDRWLLEGSKPTTLKEFVAKTEGF